MSANLAGNLLETTRHHAGRVALKLDGEQLTYADLERASARLAGWLRDHGVRPGDRVGIMLPNVPDFAVVYYGVLRAGGLAGACAMLAGMTRRDGGPAPTAVYLESGARRVFACALDWPGWCRSGMGEGAALEALAAYAPRYAVVAAEAGVPFPAGAGDAFDVVERLTGSMTTDFGAPASVAARDAQPLTGPEAELVASLVAASWTVLERVAAGAPPVLRKGPRGGGRDRDDVVGHVVRAEAAYARKLGVRVRTPDPGDAAAVAALRCALLETLRAPSDGTPPAGKGWPPRYAARRIAWHALDHAWEIEDRSERPAG